MGLIKEAESLVEYKDFNAMQTVGYKEVFGFLNNEYSYEQMVHLLKRNSRRYAKRQMTWFKNQDQMTWFHPDDSDDILAFIKQRLNEA